MEDREFFDEQVRALTARLIAQGAVIEVLLGLVLLEKPPEAAALITAHLRKRSLQPPAMRVQTDFAAEFLADVLVRSRESLELLLASAEGRSEAP